MRFVDISVRAAYQREFATKPGRLLITTVGPYRDPGWMQARRRGGRNIERRQIEPLNLPARASARATSGGFRALFSRASAREDRQGHAHPDIDSLTALVFARRATATPNPRRDLREIRILAGTIVRPAFTRLHRKTSTVLGIALCLRRVRDRRGACPWEIAKPDFKGKELPGSGVRANTYMCIHIYERYTRGNRC